MQGVGFEPTMLYAYPLKGYVLTNSTILATRTCHVPKYL